MSLDSSQFRLKEGYQTLLAAWNEAQRHWHDQVRRDFDQKYMADLGPRVFAALTAMDQMGQLLRRAVQECGEDEGAVA